MKSSRFIKKYTPRFRNKDEAAMYRAINGTPREMLHVKIPRFESKEVEDVHYNMFPQDRREIEALKKMGFKPGETTQVEVARFEPAFQQASLTLNTPKHVQIGHELPTKQTGKTLSSPYGKMHHSGRVFDPNVKNWTDKTKPAHDAWNHDEGFKKVNVATAKAEGGYANRPIGSDRGGETKYGISKNTYPNLDIKNLSKEQAKQILYEHHYLAPNVDRIADDGVRQVMYDFYVNSSADRVNKVVQKTLIKMGKSIQVELPNRQQDGQIINGSRFYKYNPNEKSDHTRDGVGEGTRAIINNFNQEEKKEFIEKFSAAREAYLQSLETADKNPGWKTRVPNIKKEGLKMLGEETPPTFEDKRHPHHPDMRAWQKQHQRKNDTQKEQSHEQDQNTKEEKMSSQSSHVGMWEGRQESSEKINTWRGRHQKSPGKYKIRTLEHKDLQKTKPTEQVSGLLDQRHPGPGKLVEHVLKKKIKTTQHKKGILDIKSRDTSSKETLVRRGDQVYRVGGKRGSRGSFYSD